MPKTISVGSSRLFRGRRKTWLAPILGFEIKSPPTMALKTTKRESSEWHSSHEAERARLVDTKVLSEFWMKHCVSMVQSDDSKSKRGIVVLLVSNDPRSLPAPILCQNSSVEIESISTESEQDALAVPVPRREQQYRQMVIFNTPIYTCWLENHHVW